MGLTNNDIFKKLRVALKLRDDEIVDILKKADYYITKSELGAFFRNEDHPKYMKLQDQILRNFLNGLVIHMRGPAPEGKKPKALPKPEKKQNKPKVGAQKKSSPKHKNSEKEKTKSSAQNERKNSAKPASRGNLKSLRRPNS